MRTAFLALALVTGPAAAAPAQDGASPPSPTMPMRSGPGMGGMGALMRADTNGDGVVTREEAIAAADARFAVLDSNRDGVVTAEEMHAGMPPMRDHGPQGAGAPSPMPPMPPITRQQFHDRALRQFDQVDANHDGRIDAAEFAAYRTMMRERRQERRDGGTPPPPPAADRQ